MEAQGGVPHFFEGEQECAAAPVILVDAQCKGGDGCTAVYCRRALSRAEDGKGACGHVDIGEGYGQGSLKQGAGATLRLQVGMAAAGCIQWRPCRWCSMGAWGR